MASDLAAVAADFIKQYEWHWWCTLTFRGNPSEVYATKLFRCWINKLNRKSFGRNYYKRAESIRWLCGTEFQQREAIHFHVLIAGDLQPTRAEATALWSSLAGDAKIDEYDPFRGAAFYLVKEYATKGNLSLGGTWPCFPKQLSGVVARSA